MKAAITTLIAPKMATAAEFLAAGRKPNAKVFAQASIEITDRNGYSVILGVADLFDGRAHRWH